MRRYTVQDLFSFQAALRDSPYGDCFSPHSPPFRRSQVAEGNLSALRHLPYQGRLSALLIGELSALLTERFFQTMRRYTVQDLFSFQAALWDSPYGGCFFPYSPLFRRSLIAEGNLSALRHLPYQGRLSALLIGELSAAGRPLGRPLRRLLFYLPPAPFPHYGKGTSPSTACINASSPSYWFLSYQWM